MKQNDIDHHVRLERLSAFRNKLASDTEVEAPEPNWNAIELALDSRTEVNSSVDKLATLENKVSKLKIAFIAMAACFVLFAAFPILNTYMLQTDADSNEVILAQIIDENNALQKHFAELDLQGQFHYSSTFRFKSTLQALDRKIQLAYLENESVDYKIDLWKQRQAMLESMLNKQNKPSAIVV